MEPLYETQTADSFDEYKRYCKVLSGKQKSRRFIIIFTVLIILSFVSNYFNNDYRSKEYLFNLIPCVLFVFVLILNEVRYKSSMKKAYYSAKALNNSIMHYKFYENEFEISNSHGYGKYQYNELYSIIETQTNFYLMLSHKQGYIIIKENCSPELIQFLSGLKAKIK